jgi:RNA polymerase sigma-70 factor (ECF subfamily)
MGTAETKRDLIAMLPRARRFARALIARPEDADALLRDACLRAVARPPRRRVRFDRWLFRLLRDLSGEEDRPPPDPGAQDAAMGLPLELAGAVVLVTVEGCSHREAGRILGVPAAAVTTRLARARRAVADMREEERGRVGRPR